MVNLKQLSQLDETLFLTDGGIETTLIYQDGFFIDNFMAFILLKKERDGLKNYYRPYVEFAKSKEVGFVLESATWRASTDWALSIGYSLDEIDEANRDSIKILEEIKDEYKLKAVISGCVGPRGDGYVIDCKMSADEAEMYHSRQIGVFSTTSADMVTAITMNYVEEAIGIAQAAKKLGMPVVISFTTETDGKLPTGQSLKDAIDQVDSVTNKYPSYFMLNCAHPTHFESQLKAGVDQYWTTRIRGLRSNSSILSHKELNVATELDSGNPEEFGK